MSRSPDTQPPFLVNEWYALTNLEKAELAGGLLLAVTGIGLGIAGLDFPAAALTGAGIVTLSMVERGQAD